MVPVRAGVAHCAKVSRVANSTTRDAAVLMNENLKIGLALGSGAARGWSHIGVIHALAGLRIEPTIVCGASIGSLVGASYISGRLASLEKWACSLTRLETARFFKINASVVG